MENMFELMRKQPLIVDKATAPDMQYKKGAIEFRNVTFKYGEDETILHNINFKVNYSC